MRKPSQTAGAALTSGAHHWALTARRRRTPSHMRLRLNIDPAHAASLASHLERQGFPPTRFGTGELEVLFPIAPENFAAAVDLALWESRGGCSSSLVIDPADGPDLPQ